MLTKVWASVALLFQVDRCCRLASVVHTFCLARGGLRHGMLETRGSPE